MPNDMPGSGMLVQTNMLTPSVSLTQAPMWLGSSMASHTAIPILPGQSFLARGTGGQSLVLEPGHGPRLGGKQGSIDILLTVGAVGSIRTVCFIADDLQAPTKFLAVRVDASNRPSLEITDHLGVTVAETTPAGAVIAEGATVSIRMAWDSLHVIDPLSGRHVTLRVNREMVPAVDWSTSPLANWVFFQPAVIMLGGSLGDADFNGTISAVQLSDVVSP